MSSNSESSREDFDEGPQPADSGLNQPIDSVDAVALGETVEDSSDASETVRPFWARNALVLVLGTAFFIYMVVVPTIWTIIDWFTPPSTKEMLELSFAESVRLHTVSGMVLIVFFCAGASIGSFLNVVIFRLPRRRPLLWPPSACASCGTKLGGAENLPIIGWLRLGGKCRHCASAVSIRYPIIELVVAGLFVLFYYRELLSGGENLPIRQPNTYHGIVWILLYTKWDLVTIYFFHMVTLILLLAWAMIDYDRFRVPRLRAAAACLLAFGLAAWFPHLNTTNSAWKDVVPAIPASVVASLAGLFAGCLVGFVLNKLFRPPRTSSTAMVDIDDLEAKAGLGQQGDAAEDFAVEQVAAEESVIAQVPDHESASDPSFAVAIESVSDATNETANAGGDMLDAQALDIPSPVLSSDRYGSEAKNVATEYSALASFALLGAVLGVEAVCVVGLFVLVLAALARFVRLLFRPSFRPLPTTLIAFVGAVIFLTFWPSIYAYCHLLIARLQ